VALVLAYGAGAGKKAYDASVDAVMTADRVVANRRVTVW
jgi:hypothetical protein